MIGRGLLVFKREPNINEIHIVDVFDLIQLKRTKALSYSDLLKQIASWKPDKVVDNAELLKIESANTDKEGMAFPDACYHPLAADVIVKFSEKGFLQ